MGTVRETPPDNSRILTVAEQQMGKSVKSKYGKKTQSWFLHVWVEAGRGADILAIHLPSTGGHVRSVISRVPLGRMPTGHLHWPVRVTPHGSRTSKGAEGAKNAGSRACGPSHDSGQAPACLP